MPKVGDRRKAVQDDGRPRSSTDRLSQNLLRSRRRGCNPPWPNSDMRAKRHRAQEKRGRVAARSADHSHTDREGVGRGAAARLPVEHEAPAQHLTRHRSPGSNLLECHTHTHSRGLLPHAATPPTKHKASAQRHVSPAHALHVIAPPPARQSAGTATSRLPDRPRPSGSECWWRPKGMQHEGTEFAAQSPCSDPPGPTVLAPRSNTTKSLSKSPQVWSNTAQIRSKSTHTLSNSTHLSPSSSHFK